MRKFELNGIICPSHSHKRKLPMMEKTMSLPLHSESESLVDVQRDADAVNALLSTTCNIHDVEEIPSTTTANTDAVEKCRLQALAVPFRCIWSCMLYHLKSPAAV